MYIVYTRDKGMSYLALKARNLPGVQGFPILPISHLTRDKGMNYLALKPEDLPGIKGWPILL